MAEELKKQTIPGIGEGVVVPVKTTLTDAESQVELADGTKVRFKTILVEAFRVEKPDAGGDPGYAFKFQPVILGVEVGPQAAKS